MAASAVSAVSTVALRLSSLVSPTQLASVSTSHANSLFARVRYSSHGITALTAAQSQFPYFKAGTTSAYCNHKVGKRSVSVHSSAADVAVVEETRQRDTGITVSKGKWIWRHNDQPVSINYVEHKGTEPSVDLQPIVLLPAYSDVSTVEEWADVATSLAKERRVVVIDWPGFGESDCPPVQYTADFMEKFLTDIFGAADGPLSGQKNPVVVGGGHAATAVIRATAKGFLTPSAIGAVAPTWGGPLPIVFGKSDKMEFRYSVLRNAIRLPGLGWALYQYGVASPKNMRMQYLTHVYSDPDNVTKDILEKRTSLTLREGARFAPASFLSGQLDTVSNREEFLALFAAMEDKAIPVLVLSAKKGPKRSKAEMKALEGAKGVTEYKIVRGALLPQEEFPEEVSDELKAFLNSL